MKAEKIRELSIDEIQSRMDDAREAYFKLRFQVATGQLTDTSRLRSARREIAAERYPSRERELAAQLEGAKV